MMPGKRSFPILWILGGLAIVVVGPIVLLTIPLRDCATCLGLQKFLVSQYRWPAEPAITCPDCADSGRVPLLKSWRGSILGERSAAVLQSQKSGQILESLRKAVEESGKDPQEFLGEYQFDDPWPYRVGFVHADGNQFLVAMLHALPLMHQTRRRAPERAVGLFLLSLEGSALDYIHVETNDWLGGITATILSEEAPDGAVARLELEIGGYLECDHKVPFTLHCNDGGARKLLGKFPFPQRPGQERVGRIAIRDGKFRVLSLEVTSSARPGAP